MATISPAATSYFVSYNHKDAAWAEWIAWVIESTGSRAKIQAWDFIPGRSWTQEMQTAIVDCDATVCVLSPDFLTSMHAASEWQAAYIKDPLGLDRKLILVRVRACEPPGLLMSRIYLDLVGKTRDQARVLLRQTLSGERLKPKSEPRFPGADVEPPFPEQRVLYSLVLEGIFEDLTKPRIEALTQQLRRLLDDGSATITQVRQGSIILVVEGSLSGFQNLQKLKKENSEIEVGGFPILASWSLSPEEAANDLIGERLEAFRRWLPELFLSEVDRETARDLTQDVIVELLTSDRLRYSALDSPSRVAQMAKATLQKHLVDRERDLEVRRRNPETARSLSREDVLLLSMDIYDGLGEEERDLLEKFWDARFDGSEKLEPMKGKTKEIDDRVRRRLKADIETGED